MWLKMTLTMGKERREGRGAGLGGQLWEDPSVSKG